MLLALLSIVVSFAKRLLTTNKGETLVFYGGICILCCNLMLFNLKS